MNILKRISLQQIAARKDVMKSIIDMQRLQIQRFQHTNSPVSLMKSMNCCYSIGFNGIHKIHSNRWYSTETTDATVEKLAATDNKTATTSKTVQPKQTFMGKVRDYLSTKKSVIAGHSLLLYGHAIDQLNQTEFATKFEMPNTFNTWFLIAELHVWMLMVRAMGEREHGMLIRNNIVDALWTDVTARTKLLAPEDARTIKKQIQELAGQFQYAIISYDEGLTKDDKQLASALWKRFFNSDCDNYEHIELMVKYIRYNISNLDHMTTEQFLRKRTIVWPSLKDMENGKY